jgi:hypothetical protein
MAVYLEKLSPFPLKVLNQATDRTINEWREASKMPPVGFILDRIHAIILTLEDWTRPDLSDLDLKKNTHPDFAGMSKEKRREEFHRMLLESQAAGHWGREKQATALLNSEKLA